MTAPPGAIGMPVPPGATLLHYGGTGVVGAAGSSCAAGSSQGTILAGLDTIATPAHFITIPFPGRIRRMYTYCTATPGAGVTVTVTVRVNHANSSKAHNVADPATSGSELTTIVAVAQGDRVAVGLTRAVGVPGAIGYGVTLMLEPL